MKVVKGGTVSRLLKDVPVPEMFHARQTFSREVIAPRYSSSCFPGNGTASVCGKDQTGK